MKWALLGLAVLSLLMCYLVGPLGNGIEPPGSTIEYIRVVATADTVIHTAAAIGAALIGAAAAVGAALIQASENKRKV